MEGIAFLTETCIITCQDWVTLAGFPADCQKNAHWREGSMPSSRSEDLEAILLWKSSPLVCRPQINLGI